MQGCLYEHLVMFRIIGKANCSEEAVRIADDRGEAERIPHAQPTPDRFLDLISDRESHIITDECASIRKSELHGFHVRSD